MIKKEILIKTSAYASMTVAGILGMFGQTTSVYAYSKSETVDYFEASPLIENEKEPVFIENNEIVSDDATIIKNKVTPEKSIKPKEVRDFDKDLGVTVIEDKIVDINLRYGDKDEYLYISNATDIYTTDNIESEVIGHLDYSDYVHCIGIDKEQTRDFIKIDLGDKKVGYIKKDNTTLEVLFSEKNTNMFATENVVAYEDIEKTKEVTSFVESEKVKVVGESYELLKIEYNGIYIYADKVKFSATPPYYSANNIKFDVDHAGDSEIVNATLKYVGLPYVWGGTTTNGFDCSGLMQYVFREHGIAINRVAQDQATNGYAVSMSQIQPGDLIFWSGDGASITHVSMYVGNGQMVHAANPSLGIIVSGVNSWSGSIVSVRRIR